MSRDKKFRAWDKDGGFYRSLEGMEWFILPDGRVMHHGSGEFVDWILEQFTGLKDKNGKEIYEGDIVFIKGGYTKDRGGIPLEYIPINYKGVVEWRDGGYPRIYDKHIREIKVIGNIRENPELLEVRHERG